MTIELVAATGGQTAELGRGFHGVVKQDLESGLVYKRILQPDRATSTALAEREYDHLWRFSRVLLSYPYLRCPEPVELNAEEAEFSMTYCPGQRVDKFLARPDEIDEHIDHIAGQIAEGIRLYVGEFGEPLYSLATHNMIYDPDDWKLSLYDFTMARSIAGVDVEAYPCEVTLGCFLSATTRYTVRARSCMNRSYWTRQRRLSVGVLRHLAALEPFDAAEIERVNAMVYPALGKKDRRLSRRAWYATIGSWLFNMRSSSIMAGWSARN